MIVTPPNLTAAPASMASAAVSNVVLTATNQFVLASHPINMPADPGSLGLVTIDHALWEHGFMRTAIFRPDARSIPDIERDARTIAEEFKALGAAERGAIIGISTTTDEYFKFEPLAQLFRKAFPDATIVAGGSHFLRDDIDGYANTLEVALRSGLVDLVQVGHASGFVDLVTKHNGDPSRVEGEGLYHLDPSSGDIIGSGVGRYPDLNQVPIEYDPATKVAYMILRNACPHNCNFCVSVADMAPRFSADTVIESLRQFFMTHDVDALYLEDSNPLERGDLDYYEGIFAAADRMKPTDKKVFLSPGQLVDREYMEGDLLRALVRYRVQTIFMGRDVVTEEIAGKIGRRYRGMVKTQERLDDELTAFKDFVGRMGDMTVEAAWPVPTRIILSYIMTPFETRESVAALMEETEELARLISRRMKISSIAPPLMPYPGSKLRRQMSGSIHMDAFDFRNVRDDTFIPWRRGAGTSLGMMSDLLSLNDSGGSMHVYLRKIANGEIELR